MKLEEVLFKGKIYTVIHKYDSGYLEIKDAENNYDVKLVHESEIRKVSERPLSN